jgi:hypothetical protein
MNERIKELILEAGTDISGKWMGLFQVEKFAELIVQECTDILNKRFMGDLNREDLEVRRCITDVKKHFGVKE